MEYKVFELDTYKIHTIKTDKFKNCSIEVMYRNKLDKKKITENNMLVDLLMYSSNKYPQRRDVSIELENLYSASIRGISSRLGNDFLVSFVLDFLNPKYCEKGFLEEVLEFFHEMLFNPNIKDGEFDKRSFNIVKSRLKIDIESLKENATRYAFRRSLQTMDEASPTSYNMMGTLEDLEGITQKNIIDTYNDIFNNYECDIYVIGNIDMDNIVELIKKYFIKESSSKVPVKLFVKNKSTDKIKDVVETGKYEQDSFIMIYNLEDLTKRERDIVIHLYNMILGSGGLTSKIYQSVREKNSLCYNIASMYQKYDQLLMIYAGIDKKDKDKCIKLINKCLDEMVNGEFSDEEIESYKKSIYSTIKMSEDTPSGIVNNYLFNELDNLPLYDERIKEFSTVTRDEIINVAKKVKLNTIYLLAGEE